MKFAPSPWMRMRSRLAAAQDGGCGGFDGEHFQLRPMLLQHLRAARDVPAGPDAGNERIGRRIGEIAQDLLGGGAAVDFDIGGIVELLRHPASGRCSTNSRAPVHGPLHALFLGSQLERGPIGKHQPPPLDAHAVGHDENQLVAFHRGDHREADAGVARGRLDDRPAGLQLARRSASSTIASAMRSLIEPPGFARSA